MLTSTTLNTRRQQRGITLIEVSIGLIIAAIIAAAAFIAFQNNSRRAEIRDNVRQITEIISETQQKIGLPNGSYAGLTAAIAVQSAILDNTVNSYNGTIVLAPASATDNNNARLTWPNVPIDQCVDLVIAAAEGVVSFNGTGTADIPVVNGTIPLATATGECSTTAPTSLEFVFARR